MAAQPTPDRAGVTGILAIEPFDIEGAHVFFLAGSLSFGMPLSSILNTELKEEFERDFAVVLRDADAGWQTKLIESSVSTAHYSKWAAQATVSLK